MEKRNNVWKKLGSKLGAKNLLWQVRTDTLINPRNQKAVDITVLTGNDAANVIPISKDGQVIMIEQYRFGISRSTLEVPGGMIDDGEDQEMAVKRELLEETGYGGGHWTYLGSIPSNPVFQDSFIHHWLATDVEIIGTTKLDDAEDITVKKMPVEEVLQLLKEDKIEHPHIVNALLRAFLKIGLMQ